MELSMNIGDQGGGLACRCGRKEYTFARGVGIVRAVHHVHHKDEQVTAVYELTSYEGIGEGYMPLERGMRRHYDAVGLSDGFVGFAEYVCEENEAGTLVLLENKRGVRNL